MTERVLCVCAHPDDETLGIGGTLARHSAEGDTVMVACLSNGVGSRGNNDETVIARRKMFIAALNLLGIDRYAIGEYPDNKFDTLPLLKICKLVEDIIRSFEPSIIYTHHRGDLNVDHRVTHKAVNVACRPKPGQSVRQLLYFEVPCSTAWGTGFEPNHWSEINIVVKLEAVRCYPTEIMEPPHPRSIEGISTLAHWRGQQVGIGPAEAFMVGRSVA